MNLNRTAHINVSVKTMINIQDIVANAKTNALTEMQLQQLMSISSTDQVCISYFL